MPPSTGGRFGARRRRRASTLWQHLGALASGIAAYIVGVALGWTSAAVAVYEGAQGFPITLEQWSWVGSLYAVGAMLGAVVVGGVVHSLGRRVSLLLIAPVNVVAFLLITWASNVWMLYLGRLLLGAGSGASCVAVPIYVCEMAEPTIRGALTSYFEVLICLGILVVFILGSYVSVYALNLSCLLTSVLYGVAFLWFPDTPRWLLLQGRRAAARDSLVFYRGDEYDVDIELRELESTLKENAQQNQATGIRAFTTRAARRGLLLTVALMVFQQICGINAVTFYTSQLFKEAGYLDAGLSTIAIGVAELVAATIALLVVDHLGRRCLLLASGVVMAVCTAMLGTYFYLKTETSTDVSAMQWVPVVFASLYVFTFSLGIGPVPWVFIGEVFPDGIKGAASALAAVSCWGSAFAITKGYPSASQALGMHTAYWFFAGVCAVGSVFVLVLVPETKGKTLDEIQEELSEPGSMCGRRGSTPATATATAARNGSCRRSDLSDTRC